MKLNSTKIENSQALEFIRSNLFSKLFATFLLIGLYPIIFLKKAKLIILINKTIACHSLDSFFIHYTNTALGGTYVAITIIILFFSIRKATIVGLSGILIFILSIICKQLLFPDFPRPTAYYHLSQYHHLIPNFEYAKRFSFPSGHTMAAFGMATVLSYVTQNKILQSILFLYAISIAFSRMYLLQHFFVDVYAGAIIGFTAVIIVLLFYKKFEKIPDRGIFSKK
jgi:membrane-associated phospholipid phosphatase